MPIPSLRRGCDGSPNASPGRPRPARGLRRRRRLSEEATRLQHEAEERAEAANVDELAERRVAEQAAASEPAGTHYAGGRRLRTY